MSLKHTFKSAVFVFLTLGTMNATAQSNDTLRSPAKENKTADNDTDLMNIVNEDKSVRKKSYIASTFKATRIINSASIENLGKGILDFRISHRFGELNQGAKNFFGLDNATTKLSFDYGLTNWLMIGLGRSTLEKEFDGFIKIKLLRQTDNNTMPVSLSYNVGMSVQTLPAPIEPNGGDYTFGNRLYYFHQVLVARKFSQGFSLQLMPTVVHYNLVTLHTEPNNVIALGVGGRLKVSHRIAITGEYYYTLPGNQLSGYHNSLSVGIDIETGGHVFQLLFTNSTGITERTFIGQNTSEWSNNGIHFGFNISRIFTVVRPKGFKNTRNKIY
ncbi:MAG: hypothetical protein H0X33_01065 [Taibaiella sp.]|nr:hypothetical protein [Taibaiella sp.]